MSEWINRFVDHHKWFCKHSRFYVCTKKGKPINFNPTVEYLGNNWSVYTFKQTLYWPIAWFKFMRLSKNEIFAKPPNSEG